ncbi:GNAT family N-acetyltransferase [Streptococcus sp. DD10]|uniref:GNAT family N-acetyltransferase n=1 Tax=Streptococcus sp. DD10 TaxID=1777878 RepID=UPI000833EA91|nr:GNAT family N-acetyltransferase [Streptococcus sp. DD10]
MEQELLIREAEPEDAVRLIEFLNQVGTETDFMTLDEEGITLSVSEMEYFIHRQALSDNQLYLLALLDDELAGVLSITADQHRRVRHIGELFIVIKKAYHNQGLGGVLLEEGIEWAETSQTIRRLQLTVQKRNQAALHLYLEMGFVLEGVQERGAYIEDKFVDVYFMGKLIG